MNRYICGSLFLWMGLCGCADEAPTLPPANIAPSAIAKNGEQAENLPDSDRVAFPTLGVAMHKPKGYIQSELFDGFHHPSDAASIMIVKVPGAYSELDEGFTPANLQRRGLRMIDREDHSVETRPGFLVHFAQSQGGQDFLKWSLIFGTEQETVMITATCPDELVQEHGELLRSALRSIRIHQGEPAEKSDDLDFSVTPHGDLKLASSFVRSALYTQGGVIPKKSPSDPMFIASPALSKVVILDRGEFAERRIGEFDQIANCELQSTNPISIDGLEGIEVVAKAVDDSSSEPVVVYQVVLFPEDSYFVLFGMVGEERRGEYLPVFKAMAQSFQRKQR